MDAEAVLAIVLDSIGGSVNRNVQRWEWSHHEFSTDGNIVAGYSLEELIKNVVIRVVAHARRSRLES